MSAVAVVMLVVTGLLVWGGLVASIVFLVRRPEVEGPWDEDTEEESRERTL